MFSYIASDYLPIFVFFIVAFGLAVVMSIIPYIVAKRRHSRRKVAQYECGFEAFSQCRSKFDIRFYLVAILFIIFDLEIAFLFPWAVSLDIVGAFGFWSMIFFLFVLSVGFLYEWKKGALDWE